VPSLIVVVGYATAFFCLSLSGGPGPC
jgi:hypothetical protein